MKESTPKTKNNDYLKVIGVGDGDGTATIVNRLCQEGFNGVTFAMGLADSQALNDGTKQSQIEFDDTEKSKSLCNDSAKIIKNITEVYHPHK